MFALRDWLWVRCFVSREQGATINPSLYRACPSSALGTTEQDLTGQLPARTPRSERVFHSPMLESLVSALAWCYSACQLPAEFQSMKRHLNPKNRTIVAATAVDLFCGAGGLTRGLLDAGISVAAGYDTAGACEYAYERNNKPAKFKKESVADLTGDELATHYPAGHTRILVGCAPCQTFSKYTQGLDNADDPKWGLLDEFARLVHELKPDIVSMENVSELQRHAIFDEFLAVLADEGFHFTEDPEKRVVYCPDYGIPQHRSRLVLGRIGQVGPGLMLEGT